MHHILKMQSDTVNYLLQLLLAHRGTLGIFRKNNGILLLDCTYKTDQVPYGMSKTTALPRQLNKNLCWHPLCLIDASHIPYLFVLYVHSTKRMSFRNVQCPTTQNLHVQLRQAFPCIALLFRGRWIIGRRLQIGTRQVGVSGCDLYLSFRAACKDFPRLATSCSRRQVTSLEIS